MAEMVKVTCKNKSCKAEFQARAADVKRGWGKFCSKSCKAKQQIKVKGPSRPFPGYYNKAPRVLTTYWDGTQEFTANFSNEEGSDI
jgi:hypothetical protein